MAALELAPDLVAEIMLRLPPTDPRCLVRASLVCKLWLGVISDPTFPHRYGAFHRIPPVLGFFHTVCCGGGGPIPRFVPITEPSPFPQPGPDFRGWWVLDCRHGLVLLDHMDSPLFAVWDPITGHREELERPGSVPRIFYTAAVLRGDHGHGADFLVVLVYVDDTLRLTRACVFSSTTGAWGAPASAEDIGDDNIFSMMCRSVAVGGAIFFDLGTGASRILKYDISKHELSVVEPPGRYGGTVLMPMEDGTLGLAETDSNSILNLWSWKVNSDGVARWVQCRVIKLQKAIPIRCSAIGSAEGVGVIFVTNGVGNFMIELKSGRVKRVIQRTYYTGVFPFTGFRMVLPVPASP